MRTLELRAEQGFRTHSADLEDHWPTKGDAGDILLFMAVPPPARPITTSLGLVLEAWLVITTFAFFQSGI